MTNYIRESLHHIREALHSSTRECLQLVESVTLVFPFRASLILLIYVVFEDWAGYPMVNPTQKFISAVKKRKQHVKHNNHKLYGRSTSPKIITQESRKQHNPSFIHKRVLTMEWVYYNLFSLLRPPFYAANSYSIHRKLKSASMSTIVITFKKK